MFVTQELKRRILDIECNMSDTISENEDQDEEIANLSENVARLRSDIYKLEYAIELILNHLGMEYVESDVKITATAPHLVKAKKVKKGKK